MNDLKYNVFILLKEEVIKQIHNWTHYSNIKNIKEKQNFKKFPERKSRFPAQE